MIDVIERTNLRFSAPNLGEPRTSEYFEVRSPHDHVLSSALKIVRRALEFLDPKFHPTSLRVILETQGVMTFDDGAVESIPLSLITSQQLPAKSEIRLGMFELENDLMAFETILAHELGHMLVEWPCRQTGVTNDRDLVITHWEKPIYEGVADWFAAIVTDQTSLGSSGIWFSRDILRFASLKEAREAPKMLLVDLEQGLNSLGLIEKYRAYSEWMTLVKEYVAEIHDPYCEGAWIAGRLWELSRGSLEAPSLARKIVELAISGQRLADPEDFLARLQSMN